MQSNLWRELLSGAATVELEVSNTLLNRLIIAKKRFHSTNLIKDVIASIVLIQYIFNKKAFFALSSLPIYPSIISIKKKQNTFTVLLLIGDAVKNQEVEYKI